MKRDPNVCPIHGHNCEGIIYLAISVIMGVAYAKVGFTHSIRSLTNRHNQLRKEGFRIIWHSKWADKDNGIRFHYFDEQQFHMEGVQPIAGLEYYRLTGEFVMQVINKLFADLTPVQVMREIDRHQGVAEQFAAPVTFGGSVLQEWMNKTGHPGPIPRRQEDLA